MVDTKRSARITKQMIFMVNGRKAQQTINGALLNLQKQILSVVLNIKLKHSVEELENDSGLIWDNIIKREFTSKQHAWLKYKIDHVMFLKTSSEDINLRSIHLVLFKIVKITALNIALSSHQYEACIV